MSGVTTPCCNETPSVWCCWAPAACPQKVSIADSAPITSERPGVSTPLTIWTCRIGHRSSQLLTSADCTKVYEVAHLWNTRNQELVVGMSTGLVYKPEGDYRIEPLAGHYICFCRRVHPFLTEGCSTAKWLQGRCLVVQGNVQGLDPDAGFGKDKSWAWSVLIHTPSPKSQTPTQW